MYGLSDPLAYIQLAPADPSRWILAVSIFPQNQFVLSNTIPDTLGPGFNFPTPSVAEFKYKDYGPVVGEPWYLWCPAGASVVTVYCASIRLREIVNPVEL